MEKHEKKHQALNQIMVWLDNVIFPKVTGYRPYWGSRKDRLFEIFRDIYPNLAADEIRGHLEENWQKNHTEEGWKTVEEILDAWGEWMFAWKNYPASRSEE